MRGVVTREQVSAGGVVFRLRGARAEVVLISVGAEGRWQLPKGIVEEGEAPEVAAAREVREETGVEAEFVAPVETIEYWYVSADRGAQVRFHKFVHFYLFRYTRGETADHDHEVNEARWVWIEEAASTLTFENERRVIERAREMLGLRGGLRQLNLFP